MTCEKCGGKINVVATEDSVNAIYRIRKCYKCGEVYYTTEKIDLKAKMLFKRKRSDRRNKNELHS